MSNKDIKSHCHYENILNNFIDDKKYNHNKKLYEFKLLRSTNLCISDFRCKFISVNSYSLLMKTKPN